MPNDKEVFQNIDYKNKTKAVPRPSRMNDIDTSGSLYDNIMYAQDNGTIDLTSLSSFTTISQSRDQVYNMLDVMAQDPTIAMALNIYSSDACEPNDEGHVVWAASDDPNVQGMVNHLLDQMNVDKNAFDWVHSLVKYGDLYLRLYRNSEYNEDELFKDKKKEQLHEDVILKAYPDNDHFAEYAEMHENPAEVFDLQKFGKTIGYIRSHITTTQQQDDVTSQYLQMQQYKFKRGDVDLYPATEFVHACLRDTSSRLSEEVNISLDEDNHSITYKVKRGQSILYNIFRVWRELSLLENSVMLNRITKSSIVRTVSVEVGDMEGNDVKNLLQRIKSMIEQKSAISVGSSYEDYTNPGPMENTIYVPTHDGKGAITTADIGGTVEPGNLTDLSYFKNKMNAGLGIPGAYLGEADTDGSLFNNGNSLSLKSSMYAKNVKRIQNAFIQAVTDAVNILLLDKGLNDYVNAFTIKMQQPATQEEKDRKENMTNAINNIREIMSLVDGIEDQAVKLSILKSLLSEVVTDQDVIQSIQDEIDRLQAEGGEETSGEEFGEEGEFGGEEPMPMGGGEEMSAEEPEAPAPMEEPEAPEEGFETGEGQLLNEDNYLPSWNDLGMSYTEYKQ